MENGKAKEPGHPDGEDCPASKKEWLTKNVCIVLMGVIIGILFVIVIILACAVAFLPTKCSPQILYSVPTQPMIVTSTELSQECQEKTLHIATSFYAVSSDTEWVPDQTFSQKLKGVPVCATQGGNNSYLQVMTKTVRCPSNACYRCSCSGRHKEYADHLAIRYCYMYFTQCKY